MKVTTEIELTDLIEKLYRDGTIRIIAEVNPANPIHDKDELEVVSVTTEWDNIVIRVR